MTLANGRCLPAIRSWRDAMLLVNGSAVSAFSGALEIVKQFTAKLKVFVYSLIRL
jgi:hypothetical protein